MIATFYKYRNLKTTARKKKLFGQLKTFELQGEEWLVHIRV